MEFGIQHGMGDPNWRADILNPEAVIAFAQQVEAAGFTHLGFTDHPAPSASWIAHGGEGVADLFTALGFCAAVTRRIRLTTWALVMGYHNPLALAHRVATLDRLSGGRLTLGVGSGYLKSEFYALGADFDNRHTRFEEHLDIMLQALSGQDIYAEGRNFSARGVRIQPPLVQQPHPPLLIYGNSEYGLQRAAASGQGWLGMFTTAQIVSTIRTTPLPDMASLGRRLDDLRNALAHHGRQLQDIDVVMTNVVPIIDARKGWNKGAYQSRFDELEALGVNRIVVNAIGDDPQASLDSALQFAADFIR